MSTDHNQTTGCSTSLIWVFRDELGLSEGVQRAYTREQAIAQWENDGAVWREYERMGWTCEEGKDVF